jgi:hypothetical protein
LLPAAALLGVLLAAVLGSLFGGPHRAPVTVAPVSAVATVVESVPCGRLGARDTVVFVIDGRSHRLPLDGCGNLLGAELGVEFVVAPRGEPTVRLAGTGRQPDHVLAERTGALLLALSGLAGALLVVHAAPARFPRPRTARVPRWRALRAPWVRAA